MNGAYYGPPIPPKNSYRGIGRSRSSCCCFRCVFNCLFKILFSILIFVAIIVFLVWLILRPSKLKAHIDSASLTKFDLSTNDTLLQYDLTLNMSIRNPNKRMGVYYDYIEAQAYYDKSTRFGFEVLPQFYQDKKTTSYITPSFNGTQVMVEKSVGTTYKRENGEGYYYVSLEIRTQIRLKFWAFKLRHMKPKIGCSLKLPVPGSRNSEAFQGTDCSVKYW